MGQVSSSPDFDKGLGRSVDNATVRVITPPLDVEPPVVYEVCECAYPDASHTTEAHYIHLDEDSPAAREHGGWVALVPNDPIAIED
jgi:hypothetical protein